MNSVTSDKKSYLAGHRYQSLLACNSSYDDKSWLCAGKFTEFRCLIWDFECLITILFWKCIFLTRSVMRIMAEEAFTGLNKLAVKSNEVLIFEADLWLQHLRPSCDSNIWGRLVTPTWSYHYWAHAVIGHHCDQWVLELYSYVTMCKLTHEIFLKPDYNLHPGDVCLVSRHLQPRLPVLLLLTKEKKS